MPEKIFKRPHSGIQLGDATDNWDVVKVTLDDGESIEDACEDVIAVATTEHLADLLLVGMGINPSEEIDAVWH